MRKTPRINKKVRRRLAQQSAAVLALGLGLAAAGPAEAAIVYTAVDQTIKNSILNFFDLGFGNLFNAYHDHNAADAVASVAANGGSGSVMVNHSVTWQAAFLNPGATINEYSPFNGGGTLAYYVSGTISGEWAGQGPGYLGLQFLDDVLNTHFGWAKLEVPADLSSLTLYSYAYETEVNAEILAGAGDSNPVPLPSSLLLLGSGAAGLLAYRRRRRAA